MKKVTMALVTVLLLLQSGCERDTVRPPFSSWIDEQSDSAALNCVLNEHYDLCCKVDCYDLPLMLEMFLTNEPAMAKKLCASECLEKIDTMKNTVN